MTTLNSKDHPQTRTSSDTVVFFTVAFFSTDIAGASTILKSEPEMIGVTCTSSVPRLVNSLKQNKLVMNKSIDVRSFLPPLTNSKTFDVEEKHPNDSCGEEVSFTAY